ncbi:hypothetical protein [Donghicola sp. XS_ASV15]|uniref:hypothetical protein n=1 Tax=Donghicola sp. XS_ASV15 TaxID=3241295 RepID=UPI003515C2DF
MANEPDIFEKLDTALRAGNFAALEELISELEIYDEKLVGSTEDDLKTAAHRSARTARLLKASRLGILEAKEILRDIQNPESRFVLYRPNGQKRNVMVGSGGKSIRA